jgi:hypothetical protein
LPSPSSLTHAAAWSAARPRRVVEVLLAVTAGRASRESTLLYSFSKKINLYFFRNNIIYLLFLLLNYK